MIVRCAGLPYTMVKQTTALAEKNGCTPAQLAIAWVRATSGRGGDYVDCKVNAFLESKTTVAKRLIIESLKQ